MLPRAFKQRHIWSRCLTLTTLCKTYPSQLNVETLIKEEDSYRYCLKWVLKDDYERLKMPLVVTQLAERSLVKSEGPRPGTVFEKNIIEYVLTVTG